MIRIAWAALVVGIVASIVSDGNGAIVAIAIVGTAGFFVWALLSGRTALKCPYCFKRVKLGAAVCHHCGRYVGRTEQRPSSGQKSSEPAVSTAPALRWAELTRLTRTAPGAPLELKRVCPHCVGEVAPGDSLCPICQRTSEPLVLHGGYWWLRVPETDDWYWFDAQHEQWTLRETTPVAPTGPHA